MAEGCLLLTDEDKCDCAWCTNIGWPAEMNEVNKEGFGDCLTGLGPREARAKVLEMRRKKRAAAVVTEKAGVKRRKMLQRVGVGGAPDKVKEKSNGKQKSGQPTRRSTRNVNQGQGGGDDRGDSEERDGDQGRALHG
jgi:hypothetical protein